MMNVDEHHVVDPTLMMMNVESILLADENRKLKLIYENFNLFHLNACSIKNKKRFEKFKDLIDSFDTNFHAIIITETWLKDNSKENEFDHLNYDEFHNMRLTKRGGGCAIYTRKELQTEFISSSNENGIEFLIVNIRNLKIKLCCVYRPPSVTILDSFITQLENICQKHGELVIVGDININLLNEKPSKKYEQFYHVLKRYNFKIMNKIDKNMATRVTSTSASILDLIITNNPSLLSKSKLYIGKSFSDHRYIVGSFEMNKNLLL